MNNISKQLKKKRDAEARLKRQSPEMNFVAGIGGVSDAYVSNKTIVNNFTEVTEEINNYVTNHIVAGDNITIIDNGDTTYTLVASGGGSSKDLLTNGSLTDTELLFADGDVIWAEV